MAANYARKTFLSSPALAKSAFTFKSPSSIASNASKLGGFASIKPSSSSGFSRVFSRCPAELGAMQSLMPLHSVTASVLLTSMLSCKAGNWGWLSEATPYILDDARISWRNSTPMISMLG
ncbi:hypothetical protein ACHQM5_007108 [Ranunculus cassubicifolius]